jgi:hypothetical protein
MNWSYTNGGMLERRVGPRRLEDITKIDAMFGKDVMGTGFIVVAAASKCAQKFATTIK